MKLAPVDYIAPRSIEQVVEVLGQHQGDAKLLSGGQSLMPMLAFRMAACRLLVDLRHVPELDHIVIDDAGVELGAKVRWRDIEHNDGIALAHPLLHEAVQHIGHYQIRNRGTVGGSLAHADPAAELPAVAVTCDAEIIVAGPNGRRAIPAKDFFLSALVTALSSSEMIVALRLPLWHARRRFGFAEFARRRGDFALAGCAVFFDEDAEGRIKDAHVGAFGVADTPVRLHAAEQVLEGARPEESAFHRAAIEGMQDLEPHTDIHAEGAYRSALLRTLLVRALIAATRRVDA